MLEEETARIATAVTIARLAANRARSRLWQHLRAFLLVFFPGIIFFVIAAFPFRPYRTFGEPPWQFAVIDRLFVLHMLVLASLAGWGARLWARNLLGRVFPFVFSIVLAIVAANGNAYLPDRER